MSEQTAEAPATEAQAPSGEQSDQQQAKPSETVDFWKQKAREQEKRAKDNADAAKRLSEIEESQKSEAEKVADRIAKAESEVASVPSKVANALRDHLIGLHGIDDESAELFLTATEPDLLLKQVNGLLARRPAKNGNHVPREGNNPPGGEQADARFVRGLFSPE